VRSDCSTAHGTGIANWVSYRRRLYAISRSFCSPLALQKRPHWLPTSLSTCWMPTGRRQDAALTGWITAAIVHLDYGNAKRAIELARRAVRANHRQDNVEGERHSKLVLLRAQAATGRVTKRHAVAAADLASVLKDRYAAERLEAQLLAGRMARQVGLTELATQQFQAASAQRRKGSALRRSAAWLATAQLADMRGDRAGMLRACERGLTVLDTHALSLGATELRARATTHGVELVRTAIGRVIEDGSARDLLRWTERWRSTLHATTTRQARQDPALTAELGKLREVERHRGSGRRRPRGKPPTHRGAHPEAHAWERWRRRGRPPGVRRRRTARRAG